MKIKTITVVGGGSSGWMTASALAYRLPNIKINLIESPTVPVIGVGESTLGHFKSYLNLLNVTDDQWMSACDATYKLAIKFCNFKHQGSVFYDILKRIRLPEGINITEDYFLLCNKYPEIFKVEDFDYWFDDTSTMIRNNKLTDKSELLDWNFDNDKAYHLNAGKFGVWLKDNVAIPNGVNHILDDVLEFKVNADGIESLVTKENGELKSDLFIDCTGFKSLLLQKTLGVKFIDYTDTLLNNRACVANVPYADKDREMVSSTESIAIENGWFWNIPLWNRIGVGYAFSKQFVDDETAIKEFRVALEKKYDKERVDKLEFKFIDFVPGRTEHRWFKNVVGIGLSSAFLEPLRSTGLLFIYQDIYALVSTLQRNNGLVRTIDVECFNNSAEYDFDGFKNMVLAEYFLSYRDDTPYWKHIANNIKYFTKDKPFYEDLSSILRGLVSSDVSQPFNIRVMAGSGITTINIMKYEELVKNGNVNFERLHSIKETLINRRKQTDSYVENLESTYEFTKNQLYKDI
jgi:hypothetical protein